MFIKIDALLKKQNINPEIPPQHTHLTENYANLLTSHFYVWELAETLYSVWCQDAAQVLLWLVKMGDKLWDVGVWYPSSELPGGQFNQRPVDRGHFKRCASMANKAGGFATVSYNVPPVVQHWLLYCVKLLLEQHHLCKSEAWIAVCWSKINIMGSATKSFCRPSGLI